TSGQLDLTGCTYLVGGSRVMTRAGAVVDVKESDPTAPSAGTVQLYAKGESGEESLYFRRSDGDVVQIAQLGDSGVLRGEGDPTNDNPTACDFLEQIYIDEASGESEAERWRYRCQATGEPGDWVLDYAPSIASVSNSAVLRDEDGKIQVAGVVVPEPE